MSTATRLNEVFAKADEISFDDSSKLILFSDCHRGNNGWADDFAHNQNLFFHALGYYNKRDFTYIEIGDGDELWENRQFQDIKQAHKHVFWRMSLFHQKKKFYLIWGNHNRKWEKDKNVKRHLYNYYNERTKEIEPLFHGISVHEGLILRHSETNLKIFLVHGHQGQFLNDSFRWLGKYVVRNIWKRLQLMGVKDPTSPAKNLRTRKGVEERITQWAKAKKQIVIAGHTHKPEFPSDGESPYYFNTGSCVHPRCITGIEIQNGSIALIKWSVKSKESGELSIEKENIKGPRKLNNLF